MTRTRPIEVLCRSKVERHLLSARFSMDFVAVLGFLFDRPSWTTPRIRGLCLSENRCLWARVDGPRYDRYVGTEEGVFRNIDEVARGAGLSPAEHAFLVHLFRRRTLDLATKQLTPFSVPG